MWFFFKLKKSKWVQEYKTCLDCDVFLKVTHQVTATFKTVTYATGENLDKINHCINNVKTSWSFLDITHTCSSIARSPIQKKMMWNALKWTWIVATRKWDSSQKIKLFIPFVHSEMFARNHSTEIKSNKLLSLSRNRLLWVTTETWGEVLSDAGQRRHREGKPKSILRAGKKRHLEDTFQNKVTQTS